MLERLRWQVKLAVVTNCSEALTGIAVAKTRIHFTKVVTAERAGFYKPHPQGYRLALEELKVEAARALFVAGSPADLPGATSVGMPMFWHNRLGLPLLDSSARPEFMSDSLWSIVFMTISGT